MVQSRQSTPWYTKHSPDIGKAFDDLYTTLSNKGVLDSKTRELLMVAVSNVFRCTHCTEAHLSKAEEAGASKAEIAEALLIASVVSAGTQLYWAKDSFDRFFSGESVGRAERPTKQPTEQPSEITI